MQFENYIAAIMRPLIIELVRAIAWAAQIATTILLLPGYLSLLVAGPATRDLPKIQGAVAGAIVVSLLLVLAYFLVRDYKRRSPFKQSERDESLDSESGQYRDPDLHQGPNPYVFQLQPDVFRKDEAGSRRRNNASIASRSTTVTALASSLHPQQSTGTTGRILEDTENEFADVPHSELGFAVDEFAHMGGHLERTGAPTTADRAATTESLDTVATSYETNVADPDIVDLEDFMTSVTPSASMAFSPSPQGAISNMPGHPVALNWDEIDRIADRELIESLEFRFLQAMVVVASLSGSTVGGDSFTGYQLPEGSSALDQIAATVAQDDSVSASSTESSNVDTFGQVPVDGNASSTGSQSQLLAPRTIHRTSGFDIVSTDTSPSNLSIRRDSFPGDDAVAHNRGILLQRSWTV
ncbi:hypothetical protein SCAR479_13436 [Seiridium cardinale]|uniref:Uncharacterized protein n=1 Tax=Seiridium cardinale TaxID=138064 RepID=A0ABR2X7Y2_9PEZI